MSEENGNKYISWEEFDQLSNDLADLIKDDEMDFSGIVSIAKGGLVIGCVLSDKLGLPLHTVHTNRYSIGNGDSSKSIASGIITGNNELTGNILVVDDLTNTGLTLERVITKLKRNEGINQIKSATIFNKSKSKFHPNYFVRGSDEHIIFPYEKTEFGKGT